MQIVEIITSILDVAIVILLILTSCEAYKLSRQVPSRLVLYLFVGFLLMAVNSTGFVLIDFIPLGTPDMFNRNLAEWMVAVRIIPMALIYWGTRNMRIAANNFFKDTKGWDGRERRKDND